MLHTSAERPAQTHTLLKIPGVLISNSVCACDSHCGHFCNDLRSIAHVFHKPYNSIVTTPPTHIPNTARDFR